MRRGKKATRAPESEQPVSGTTATGSDPVSAIITTSSVRPIQRWRVDALKPNAHNQRLFPDSLGDASIALLAEDLEHRGQDVPVRITPSGIIVDGERRVLGAKKLGRKEIDVVVGPELTDAEMLDHVISACTSARQMSVREQFNIFTAIVEQMKWAVGRTRGRPGTKMPPIGSNCLSAQQISEIAAAKARFDSARSAERAKAIFTRGPEELQEQVSRGDLSIGGGYALLPKQMKSEKADHENQVPDDSSTDSVVPMLPVAPTEGTAESPHDDAEMDHNKMLPPSGKSPNGAPGERNVKDNPFEVLRKAAQPQAAPGNDVDGVEPDQKDERADTDWTGPTLDHDETEHDEEDHTEGHDAAQDETELRRDADDEDADSMDLDFLEPSRDARRWKTQVRRVARELRQLISSRADGDYDEASTVLEEIITDLREGLGERPPQNDDQRYEDRDDQEEDRASEGEEEDLD
ncbi:MAG: ParB/RepB/Spo0J family partition protein [Deltaproteobacteria bacterium]